MWFAHKTVRSIDPAIHRSAHINSSPSGLLLFYTQALDIYRNGEDSRRDSRARMGLSNSRIQGKDTFSTSTTTPMVSNVDGGELFDGRIHGPMQFGPFESIQKFHYYLRGGIEAHVENPDGVNELIAWQDGPWDTPVFTHGDLSSLNILARGDKIVGIIDWETAGWYPAYWEYTTAMQTNPQNLFWKDEIDSFLNPMPMEQAMEKVRQRYFGDF